MQSHGARVVRPLRTEGRVRASLAVVPRDGRTRALDAGRLDMGCRQEGEDEGGGEGGGEGEL